MFCSRSGLYLAAKSLTGAIRPGGRSCKKYSLFVDPISALTQKKVEYRETKHLGFSCEQVYDVVADVDRYKVFLPWCQESRYVRRSPSKSIAKLNIGFPPLTEAYTALVLTQQSRSIRAISTDGTLFSHLENDWVFKESEKVNNLPTCTINFYVCFEFRSTVTARLGMIVFDEVARMMAGAFEARCRDLYGPSALETVAKEVAGSRKTPHTSLSPLLTDYGTAGKPSR